MQQAVNTTQRANALLAIAKALADPYTPLTPQMEADLAQLLPGYAPGQGMGFPGGPAGDVRGKNALRRTNWFNGRFLTAEALRRQDAYNDTRDRLLAHTHRPGIAWGLGIEAPGANTLPVGGGPNENSAPPRSGGFPANGAMDLTPGLAFDHIGRPILVQQPFRFTLADLVAPARSTPRRVVPGGTEFAPCVCLAPDPEGASGGGAALRPGPWLLIIEAGESAEGQAKVMGEACAGPSGPNCEAESWRGGFGLSLVRVPVELPDGPGLDSAWALRGTMSAWWHDVFEHSLITRWDPSFATGDGFRRAVGPMRQEAGAVALAMVWLGVDGSAIFLDPWIARRSIVATTGEDWHRTRFGAPPRAAAWGRIHQFQAMLAESLRQMPLLEGQRNLFDRGFRHIPPIGFLPLDPDAIGSREREEGEGATGNATLDRIVQASGGRIAFVSGMIAAARRQLRVYFEGTTVIAYGVVALHDDDILEDLANVFDKDPVRVAQRGALTTRPVPGRDGQLARMRAFLEVLARLFEVMGLDELVNRRTEIVKVILPLQGLSREHPVLGRVATDARGQAEAWLGASTTGWFTAADTYSRNAAMSRLPALMPLDMLPRHFAVYVKQRMVLLDALVLLLEILEATVLLLRDMLAEMDRAPQQEQPTPVATVPGAPQQQQSAMTMAPRMTTTDRFREAYLRQPAERRAVAEALLAEPIVQQAVAQAAVAALPEFRVPERNAAFLDAVRAREAELAPGVADAGQRQRLALSQLADSYAAEHEGFQVIQLLAAVQPAGQARGVVEEIGAVGARSPLRDAATGARATETVADRVTEGGPRVFEKSETALAYGAMRAAIVEKSASAFVAEAPPGITAKEILAKPPEEAVRILGSEERLAAFTAAVRAETKGAAEAAVVVTEAPPPPELTAALARAVEKGEDSAPLIASARRAAAGDAAKLRSIEGAETMVQTLGPERTLALARTLKRQG